LRLIPLGWNKSDGIAVLTNGALENDSELFEAMFYFFHSRCAISALAQTLQSVKMVQIRLIRDI